jgi:CRP/FNR family transcriptional regulator, dissimilatory nitrate respiration regulator
MSDLPSLRSLPLFASLDDATLYRLALDAKIENYVDGAVIFRQGDAVSAVMVIMQGFVKLLRTASCGDETLVCVCSGGASISDPPTVPNETFQVSAEAVGTTSVLKVPAGRFMRIFSESPALAAAALGDAKQRIASLVGEIESLKAQSADQRLARFILSHCPPNEEQCRFRLPYDKRLVAAQLGVTQETLSRAFARLREFGVRTETRDVSVESVTRLCLQYDELGRSGQFPASGFRRAEDGCDCA